MDSQELGLKALATMEDLVNAITDSPETELEENREDGAENDGAQTNCDTANAQNILSTRLSMQDKLSKDEFIFGMFEDGFYPGQVLKDCGDKVDAIFMTEQTIQGSLGSSFWKWPSTNDRQLLRKMCILKIRPNLDIASQFSTRRCIVYKLINLELVEKFVCA